MVLRGYEKVRTFAVGKDKRPHPFVPSRAEGEGLESIYKEIHY